MPRTFVLTVALVLAACGSSGGGGGMPPGLLLSHDLDGDGFRDLVVGASSGGAAGQGEVHIFFGPNFASTADIVITGEAADDDFGLDLDASGDMNGDRIADLLVGARDGPATGNADAGRAYVIFGRRNRADIPRLAANANVRIEAEPLGERFGTFVKLGDLNRDGLADAIVTDGTYNGGQGRVYVFFGAAGLAPTTTTAASADNVITGDSSASNFIGSSGPTDNWPPDLAVGDLNRDGFNDLVVGSPGMTTEGMAHVFFGSATGIGTRAVATADLVIDGVAAMDLGDELGSGIVVADLDHDGLVDLLIGDANSRIADGTNSHGSSHLFVGSDPMWTTKTAGTADYRFDNSSATATTFDNEDFGSAAGYGDVNGDGIRDLVIADYEGDEGTLSDSGLVFVFFGPITASTRTEQADVRLSGSVRSLKFGRAVSVRDYDGDGIHDILVGAYANATSTSAGQVFLFRGRAMWPATLTSAAADHEAAGTTLRGLFGVALAE